MDRGTLRGVRLVACTLCLWLVGSTAAQADQCVGADYDVPIDALEESGVFALGTGVSAAHSTWIGNGQAGQGGEVIRSVWVAHDLGFLNWVEWGFYRDPGSSTIRQFFAWNINGTYSDTEETLPTVSPGTYTWKQRVRPSPDGDGFLFDGYRNASLVSTRWHNFGEGFISVLTERHGTCDDNHSKWNVLQIRQNGNWWGWEEFESVPPTDIDPVYGCRKGLPDTTAYVKPDTNVTDGPNQPCVVDVDPSG